MGMDEEYRKRMAAARDQENDGEEREYEPLPEGFYRFRIGNTGETEKAGESGYTQQVFVMVVMAPRAHRNAQFREWISYSPKAAWKMAEFYDAADFTYDSDPSELVGETVIAELEIVEQEYGKRKGQKVNKALKYYSEAEAGKLVGK